MALTARQKQVLGVQGASVVPLVAASPQTVSALPATVNLALYQGDDMYLDLTVTDPDGSAADLTGATPKAEIRTAPSSDVVAAEFVITGVSANTIHLHLPHAASAALGAGEMAWDCQLTRSSGDITTLAAGRVSVTGEVTRP
jgi:hypothetical protein